MDMPTSAMQIISHSEATARLRRHAVYGAEFPEEHHQSILLPTFRLGFPAFAFFSSPARRVPGQPLEVAAPDRWGALRADFGRLALFALVEAVPLGGSLERVALPRDTRTLAEALAAQDRLSALLDQASASFLAERSLPSDLRETVEPAFAAVVPDVLRPAYRALAPDFMEALETAG